MLHDDSTSQNLFPNIFSIGKKFSEQNSFPIAWQVAAVLEVLSEK